MTTPITTGYGSNAARTVDEMKQLVEDVVALLKEQPGGIGKTAKTLSADSFALDNSASYFVLTGQGGTADDLATITGGVNGREIIVRSADAGNIITLKHGTGANKIRTKTLVDVPLKDGMLAHLRFDSALGAGEWETLRIYHANQLADERSALGLGTAAVVNTGTGAGDVPTITNADGRYAKLAGLSTQTFACATPGGANDATPKSYVDTAVASGTGFSAGVCQFRLTTETGVPVSSSDRTAQSTLYLTPMYGNAIGLKISGTWQLKFTAEISLALSGLTSGKNYDVFAYWDGAAVALELLIWSDDLNRATVLARDSGAWVKSGDATRLYVGTIRTTGTTTTEDSAAKRFVWNHFNRERRSLKRTNLTSHSYATASWRAFNNDAANSQVEFVLGLAEEAFIGTVAALIAGTGSTCAIGMQIDATTSNGAGHDGTVPYLAQFQTATVPAEFRPAIGYHFIAGVERAAGSPADFDDLILCGSIDG